MTLTQTLSANLRREMSARGLSAKDLADRLKWHAPRLFEILRGEHSPKLKTVEQLAEALDLSPTALLLPIPESEEKSSEALLTS